MAALDTNSIAAGPAATSEPNPVRVITRLRWTLLRRQMQSSTRTILSMVVGALIAAGMVLGLGAMLLALSSAHSAAATPGTVVFIASVTLTTLVVAPLALGVDDTLAPHKFALLPLKPRALFAGIALSTLIGLDAWVVGLVALVTLAFSSAALIMGGMAVWLALVVCIVGVSVSFVMALLVPRAVLAYSGLRRPTRKQQAVKQWGSVLVTLLYVAAIQVFPRLTGDIYSLTEAQLETVMAWTQWVPTAWPALMLLNAASGTWLIALLQALGTVLLIGACIRRWYGGVCAAQTVRNANQSDNAEVKSSSTAVLRGLPSTPGGAISSRLLKYFRRDARFNMPMLLTSAYLIGLGGLVIFTDNAGLIYGMFALIQLRAMEQSNAFGFDGPALWNHLVTGVEPATEIRARIVAQLPWIVGATLVMTVVAVVRFDAFYALGLTLGSLANSAAALGIATFFSVAYPYGAPPPGTNTLKTKNNQRVDGVIPRLLSSLGISIVVALPMMAGVNIYYYVHHALAWIALAIGVALSLVFGALTAWIAFRRTNAAMATGMPEVFAAVRTWG